MKRGFLWGLLLLTACNTQPSGGGLVWDYDTVSRSGSRDVVALIYPVATEGAAADSINRTLETYLKRVFVGDSLAATGSTLAEAVDSLLARKNRDTMIAHMPYQFHSEGEVYTRGNLTSVWLQTYAFTGGAHGLTLGRFFNFDNRTGEQVPLERLVSDTTRLATLNRNAFKESLRQRNLSPEDIAAYLFVNPDALPLPQNIGFDSIGVKMLYNQYEIAVYAFGQSVYTLPYSEVESLLEDMARGR